MNQKPLPYEITRLLNPTDLDRLEIIAWELKQDARDVDKAWTRTRNASSTD